MKQPASEEERSIDQEIHDVRLVNASLGAAISIEVLPIEAGLLHLAFIEPGSIPIYLCIKTPLLLLILTPLGWYLWTNGLRAIVQVKWRVACIAAIVVFNLIANFIVIFRMCPGST